MKLAILLAMFSVSTAYAAEEYSKRAIPVYCGEIQQVLDKIKGIVEISWKDQDGNVWVSFKATNGGIALAVVPSDNHSQMCIVSYGKNLVDNRKYL